MEMQDRPLEGVSQVAYDVLRAGCVLPASAYPQDLVQKVADAIRNAEPVDGGDLDDFLREQAYAALDAVARFLR